MMPWPAKISGRSAALISAIGSTPIECPGRASAARSGRGGVPVELAVLPSCASFVMSTSTGPGRPLAAIANASRIARRHVAGARDEVVVLGDRQRDAGDVGLLKRVGPDERGCRPAR